MKAIAIQGLPKVKNEFLSNEGFLVTIRSSGRSTRNAYALESLCRDILEANKWLVESLDMSDDLGVDIVALDPSENTKMAFEVKYTRNSNYPTSALMVSAVRLMEAASSAGIEKAVLLIAADINHEVKFRVEQSAKVQILDINDLISLASVDLELLGKLIKLCEIDLSERSISGNVAKLINPIKIPREAVMGVSKVNESHGLALIDKLRSIPHGREGCYDFEDLSSQILKYLFDENLTGWHQQARTTDALHRYDLVCRVIDNSTIWKFISRDLDSRYVLFEFKNYSEKITQSQVYSTEKYLLDKAKRKVCFLISRLGPSDNAFTACQGAMREHGKMIICLDDDDIIRMIESRMVGNDPNELVFEKLDRFLMELPR